MNYKIHPSAEVSDKAEIGEGTYIWNNAQIRENAKIGKTCIISKNVYIDANVIIVDNVKIQNNVSVYCGVTIEDGVFIGPHVCFTNDKIPRAINRDGTLKLGCNWEVSKILVKKGASIGANATILPGVIIGEFAMIGSGAVVTKDVPDYGLVFGNPAKLKGLVCKCGAKLDDEFTCANCSTKTEIDEETKKLI
ncbi:acetyltransferase [Candidatus Woesearchaeota archaeon]|nr:acetyltransferase [Candidatus Woesearchaeota archaeon]